MTKVTDALYQVYDFTYDPLGRQLSQTRAGMGMSYEYDVVGNRMTHSVAKFHNLNESLLIRTKIF